MEEWTVQQSGSADNDQDRMTRQQSMVAAYLNVIICRQIVYLLLLHLSAVQSIS